MRYFYDTEFNEDGKTIDLISIGIVREDGATFYAINNEFDENRAKQNLWLVENVLNKLDPIDSPNWQSRQQIVEGIIKFIGNDQKPIFYGYYAAYDHVALCQLFGKMIDLPRKYPMYTRDLKQMCDAKGNPRLPEQGKGEHNALADAKWNQHIYNFLRGIPYENGD